MGESPAQRATDARIPVWIAVVVIIGAVLLLVGAFVSKVDPALLTNNSPMNDAARVYADYTFARDLALAIMLLFLVIVRARRMLAGFMVLVALIQFVDILNDLARGAFILIPGLLLFAILFVIGAQQLFGGPLWQMATWRDR